MSTWKLEGRTIVVDERTLVCCGRRIGGECCGEPDVDGRYERVAEFENEADAALAFAAPVLLEFAQAYVSTVGPSDKRIQPPWITGLYLQAKAAIALATPPTGETT